MPADNLPTVAIAMMNTLRVQQKTTRHSLRHDETNNHMGKNKLYILYIF